MKIHKEYSGMDLGSKEVMQRSTLKRLIAQSTGAHGRVQTFAIWAFGKPINQDFDVHDMVRLWNHRRGNLHQIDLDNVSCDCIDLMVNLWRENYTPPRRERSSGDLVGRKWTI